MIWKKSDFCRDGRFLEHPIYFLYLLAHLSFYFQKIHFQTLFHLPSLLLSCCFFCTQTGNLFWKRCFNISISQQSSLPFSTFISQYVSSSQGAAEEYMMRFLPPQNPQSQMQPGSCNMHNPLKASSKKSISLYWGGGQGRKQHGKNVQVWNK